VEVDLLGEVDCLVEAPNLVGEVDCLVAGEDYREGVDFLEEVEAV
jgi:hypothetical protein